MGDEIRTIKLPPSCIASNNEPCPIQIRVDNLESGNKELIKSNLFFMLGSMDTIITESIKYIEKGLPFYVKAVLAIKNASKVMALNISDDNLNYNDILNLGSLQIGIGLGLEWLIGAIGISGGWTLVLSISGAMIVSYFLSKLYIDLKDKFISFWKNLKNKANTDIQNIMSLIETDTRSLEERKEAIRKKQQIRF